MIKPAMQDKLNFLYRRRYFLGALFDAYWGERYKRGELEYWKRREERHTLRD